VFYDFPISLGLDEVRLAVKNHNQRMGATGFIEADRGDHVIFNYVVAFADSFPQPTTDDPALNREYAILRECRGLVFDKTYGVLLSRRYHKFFNINEKSFTQTHLLDFSQPHEILEKLDGSMVAPYPHAGRPDGIAWATKMGVTEQSYPVEAFVAKNPQYRSLFFDLYERGFSPLFEWCSRQQKIVVDYKVEQLVLTGVRSLYSGAYAEHAALVDLGQTYGIPVVRALPGSVENIEQFMADAYDLEGSEGYIIRFANGHMLKIKGRWYTQIHRTKDNLTREKDVWQMILNDRVDDIKPFMDADDRDRVDRYLAEFEKRVGATAQMLALTVHSSQAIGLSKKDFASWVSEKYLNRAAHGLLFAIWDGQDPVEVVKKFLAKNFFTATRIENVRWAVSGLKWDDYRDTNVVLDD
jgi:RNA ligase